MTIRSRLVSRAPRKLRRSIVRARHSVRSKTSERRALPAFLIIGTQRGGTSSLYRYLSEHPQITPSLRKETEYFAGKYALGLSWYKAHFPKLAALSDRMGRPQRMTFEATPDYLLHPYAARRASQLVPNAKIVGLLRDPVERAFSHHRHMLRRGFESLPFRAAIEVEEERCADDWERLSLDEMYRPRNLLRFSYVERGHYAEQLARWLDEYDRDKTLFVISERFFTDTEKVFAEIIAFLGLDDWKPDRFPNHSAVRNSSEALGQPMRAQLMDHYQPYNKRLETLIGRDPGWGY